MWFGGKSFLHVYTSAGKVAPAPASASQFPVEQHRCITEQVKKGDRGNNVRVRRLMLCALKCYQFASS